MLISNNNRTLSKLLPSSITLSKYPIAIINAVRPFNNFAFKFASVSDNNRIIWLSSIFEQAAAVICAVQPLSSLVFTSALSSLMSYFDLV